MSNAVAVPVEYYPDSPQLIHMDQSQSLGSWIEDYSDNFYIVNLEPLEQEYELAALRLTRDLGAYTRIYTTCRLHPILRMAVQQAYNYPETDVHLFFDNVNCSKIAVSLYAMTFIESHEIYGVRLPENLHLFGVIRKHSYA